MRDIGRRGQSQRTQARSSTERLTIIVLFVFSLALVMIGRTEPEFFDSAKRRAMTMLAPVLDTVSGPVNSVRNWRRALSDLMTVHEDNKRLRHENQELRAEAAQTERLQNLLERYQALLNVKVDPRVDYLTARVIGDSGGPFARSLLINVGIADGVRSRHGVIDANGLLGHVVSTGPHAARVLLLTDVESHIPVSVEPDNVRAMLTGDGRSGAFLEHIPLGVTLQPGSRVTTSGVGGLLPPGLLIGYVGALDKESNVVHVKLATDFDRLDVVRVLRFEQPLDAEIPDSLPLLQPPVVAPPPPAVMPTPSAAVPPAVPGNSVAAVPAVAPSSGAVAATAPKKNVVPAVPSAAPGPATTVPVVEVPAAAPRTPPSSPLAADVAFPPSAPGSVARSEGDAPQSQKVPGAAAAAAGPDDAGTSNGL